MKRWHISIILCFFLPIIVLAVYSALDSDQQIAYDENRTLETMPILTFDSWFDESFALGFERYYNDHFPQRERFISGNQMLNAFYMFDVSPEDSTVIIAQDSDMLLTGGDVFINEQEYYSAEPTDEIPYDTDAPTVEPSQAPIAPTASPAPEYPQDEDAQYAGSSVIIVGNAAMEVTTIGETSIDKYALIVNEVARRSTPATFYNLIVPTGGQFYSPESYHTDEYDQQKMIDRCYSQLDGVIGVDAYTQLYEHVDEYIYYRTDHHWTARGAYYGYVAFCQSAGLTPLPLSDFETGQYDDFVGSLYGYVREHPQSIKLKENPDYVEYFIPVVETEAYYYNNYYMKNAVEIDVINTAISDKFANKYLCFVAGDCPLQKIETSQKNGRSVLLVKESYGNAFAPFLTSHYETVYTLDPRKFNTSEYPNRFYLADFVKTHEIDDVIILNNTFMINSRGFGRLLAATIN